MRGTTRGIGVVALALWAASVAPARAQGPTFTGWELALSGPTTVRAGRTARFRGVAYRVRGLAELVPQAAPVRARFAWHIEDAARASDPAWIAVRADREGRFELELPVPEGARAGEPRVEVEVGPERRRFDLGVAVGPALELVLRTDRRLYEPGEPVHLFGLLRDAVTGRPIEGREVTLSVTGAPMPETARRVTTTEAGVAHVALEVPARAPHGEVAVEARVDGQLDAVTRFAVGARTWERLLVDAAIEPEPVAPGATATLRAHVTTPSGAPVAGAHVVATVDRDRVFAGRTDADGVLRLEVRAPSYLSHDTGTVYVELAITHPAHGSIRALEPMRLAIPLSLHVEVIAPHGGLVPEIDDVLYVQLRDGLGDPPPAGTSVTLEGPAIRGGRASATTDVNGLATLPARLPLGAASRHRSGEPDTSVRVTVAGPLERVSRAQVPVLPEAEVVPMLDRVLLEPGDALEVRVARRPSARRREVVVELLGSHDEPLAIRWLGAHETRARFDVPHALGLASVRARAVHADEVLEGAGAIERVIVRPARPDFLRVEPERERWTVGETARVRLHTVAGGPRAFAAVLVRDLAAHGGEVPFSQRFLSRAFDRAILEPSPAGDALVRAALAAHALGDPEPHRAPPLVDALGREPYDVFDETESRARGLLRDPFPIGRELARRRVAEAMRVAEARLAAALEGGTLDTVTTGTGAGRRFVDDLFADDDGEAFETLGGAPLTPAILEAADPSFTYLNVARRVARRRLVRVMVALARYLDPGDEASPAARMAAREPSSRWLPRMIERGVLGPRDLDDPFGGRFALVAGRAPVLVLAANASALELVSPGPDGRAGTADDVRDPFARAVPAHTPYAVASGEDRLMRQLSVLSVAERTLAELLASYERTSAEMREEQIGDAVSAEVSEGTIGLGSLGTIGHGGGSGGGSGYGRGGGGMVGRSSRVPTVRVGLTSSNLAALVRERFPPTLLFRPAMVLETSGVTEIAIPLADAVTSYLIEAIVWREDGWIWSESARIEVDRDLVVEAPVPPIAHRGDRLRLPLRVSNRSERELRVSLLLRGDRSLGVPDSTPVPLVLAPGAAEVHEVEVAPTSLGEGALTVVALGPDGAPLDAVRRPMTVLAPARAVERTREALADGEVRFDVEVPEGAQALDGALRVTLGRALFAGDMAAAPEWAAWAGEADAPTPRLARLHHAQTLAIGIGGAWASTAIADDVMVRAVDRLTQLLAREERAHEADPAQRLRTRARALLGLAPAAARHWHHDAEALLALRDRLRREVASASMALADDPAGWALAAAALASHEGSSDRVAELLRRVERHVVAIDEDRWLPTEQPVRSTVHLAMAELGLGRRDRAFTYLRTIARWAARGHPLDPEERALARATATRLMDGAAPEAADVWIDGAHARVSLRDGGAVHEALALATPGRHRVRVRAEGAPLWVTASARFGVAWDRRPPRPGPFALALDGDLRGRDEVAELSLTVRNRMPRTLARPTITISLPTGAELTAEDQARVRARAVEVTRGDGVLHVVLPPMLPGQTRTVPLPLRWTVAGTLAGIGVSAHAADRPEAVSVLPPEELVIVGGAR